ncbi:MAG: hypothetical protein II179_00520 [Alphaproteobacteria bacterium]|nr:hypothetical protein [Alphaproteobacteria bacterium]
MEKYMSVDEFLEKYYTALNRGDWGALFFWSMASETPQKFFKWYEEHKTQIKTPELQELYAELAKAMQSGTPDAKNFLYTIQVLTAFYDSNVLTGKLEEYTKVILYAIEKGTIKNPKNSYQLLEGVNRHFQGKNQDVARTLAMHPLATPYDVQSWLSYYLNGPYYGYPMYTYKANGLSTPKFVGSINDAKKKLNDLVAVTKTNMDNELNKPMPDINTIEYLGVSVIPSIALQILTIVAHFAKSSMDGQTEEDVAKAKAVADELAREFDMDKILDVSNGNYVQQYADQAEIQLAEMRPAFEKMQQELETLRPERIKMTNMWDEERQKVQKLEGDKEKLLRENNNLISTIDFLKGKIKLFLAAFKRRAEERELPIKKAKGLQEVVANDLEGAVNIEQIERDLSTARQRQTEIMRNSPVRI